jgi:hypothetical protein
MGLRGISFPDMSKNPMAAHQPYLGQVNSCVTPPHKVCLVLSQRGTFPSWSFYIFKLSRNFVLRRRITLVFSTSSRLIGKIENYCHEHIDILWHIQR